MPQGIQIWFAVSTGATVRPLLSAAKKKKDAMPPWQINYALQAACSACAMAMCSLVLMSIIKTGSGLVSGADEAAFMADCQAFAQRCCFCLPGDSIAVQVISRPNPQVPQRRPAAGASEDVPGALGHSL